MMELPKKLIEEGKLKNIATILNGGDRDMPSYGKYGYIYGYIGKRPSRWLRF